MRKRPVRTDKTEPSFLLPALCIMLVVVAMIIAVALGATNAFGAEPRSSANAYGDAGRLVGRRVTLANVESGVSSARRCKRRWLSR